jgi:hypothetical protein
VPEVIGQQSIKRFGEEVVRHKCALARDQSHGTGSFAAAHGEDSPFAPTRRYAVISLRCGRYGMREITLTEHPGCDDSEWVIVGNDCDGEGGVSTIVFIGKYAHERAECHCQRLKTHTD